MKHKFLIFCSLILVLFFSCQRATPIVSYEEVLSLERENTNKIHTLATESNNIFILAKMKNLFEYDVFLVDSNILETCFCKTHKFVTQNKIKKIKIGMSFEDIVFIIGSPAYIKREENADIAYYFQNYFSLLSTKEKIGISAYVLKLQFVENKLIFKEEEYISRA